MKILLVQITGLIGGSGGCEKIVSILANHFFAQGHQVLVATNENKEGDMFYPLTDGIEFYNLYQKAGYFEKKKVVKYHGPNLIKWLCYKIHRLYISLYNKHCLPKNYELLNMERKANVWKKFVSEHQIDLILTINIAALLEMTYRQNYDIPFIDSCNGRPDYDYSDILSYRSPEEIERLKESYKHLAGIQILFENYRPFLPETCTCLAKVIPNFVPQVADDKIVYPKTKSTYHIIMVARLDNGKKQTIAINVFAQIAHQYPNWILDFYGDGPAAEEMQQLIKKYHLENQILMHGVTDRPIDKMLDSDIFIFPSQFEGFPLALTEAMSCGLPAIGFTYCSGVNELIRSGENGLLAKDEQEMQTQLEQLINNPELRQKLGQQAHQDMKQYTPENFLSKWDELIQQVMEAKNG